MFKKIIAASLMGLILTAGVVEAKSRSSSSRSSFSSSKSYSVKKSYSAPRSKPKVVSSPSRSAVVSQPASKIPASKKVVSSPRKPATIVNAPSTRMTRAIQAPSTSRVVKAPVRRVSSPVSRNVTINKTKIVQKNYYSGSRYNTYRPRYNRGYGSYGGGYGGYNGGGSGLGTALMGGMLGAIAGSYIYDSLTDNPAVSQTVDTVQQAGENVVDNAQEQVQNVLPEGGFGLGEFVLPPDAPLMMAPSFYAQ